MIEKKSSSLERRMKRAGFLFSLPALCFYLLFFLYPVLFALGTSFTKWDFVHDQKFVGLTNYLSLFRDEKFLQSLLVTLYYAGGTGFFTLSIAFTLALILDTELALHKYFKVLFFVPSIISVAVIGIIFAYMYQPIGLITIVVNNLIGISLPWTASYYLAMPSVIIMMTWTRVGFYMLIFLSGLSYIPQSYYEAAKIDGARYRNILIRIILPLMNPVILLASILMLTECFRAFTPFYILTDGGPGGATTSLTLRIYRDGMEALQMGKASAESVFAILVMLVFTAVYLKIFGKETEY